jgi:hypothetical protein
MSLWDGCPAEGPCDVDLTIQLDWAGGGWDEADVEWSLAAWAGAGEGLVELTDIGVTAEPDLAWKPVLMSSVEGRTVVTDTAGAGTTLSAIVDLTDVEQGEPDLDGMVRLELTAEIAADGDPSSTAGFRIGETANVVLPGPGVDAIAYSMVEDMACEPRSLCRVTWDVSAFQDSSDLPQVAIEWTATAEFVPREGAQVPSAANFVLDVGAPP